MTDGNVSVINKSNCVGVKKHRAHRIRKKRMPQLKHQQQQSLEHVVQQVQQIQHLDKDDVVDEKTSLYKFTVCHSWT